MFVCVCVCVVGGGGCKVLNVHVILTDLLFWWKHDATESDLSLDPAMYIPDNDFVRGWERKEALKSVFHVAV